MIKWEVNVYVEPDLKAVLDKSWFESLADEVLGYLSVTAPAELGLVITDNETIQQLNRTYRSKDEPTDVLAFPMLDHTAQGGETAFIVPPDGIHHLGEVVISYPQAMQQAEDRGQGIERELTTLFIHGILHLLGYDHEMPEEEQYMMAKEEEVVKRIRSHEGTE